MEPSEILDLARRADKGEHQAQYQLGRLYLYGNCGLTSNADKALALFYRAARRGNINAQFRLGQYYWRIKDTKDEALRWFRAAARQGDARAIRRINSINKLLETCFLEHFMLHGVCQLCGMQQTFTEFGSTCKKPPLKDELPDFKPPNLEPLVNALSEFLCGKTIPVEIVDDNTGMIVVAANRVITKPQICNVAAIHDRIAMDDSPEKEKLIEIINGWHKARICPPKH
jgi:hypothetical protein